MRLSPCGSQHVQLDTGQPPQNVFSSSKERFKNLLNKYESLNLDMQRSWSKDLQFSLDSVCEEIWEYVRQNPHLDERVPLTMPKVSEDRFLELQFRAYRDSYLEKKQISSYGIEEAFRVLKDFVDEHPEFASRIP